MLHSYARGSVLALLPEVFREYTEEARQAAAEVASERCRNAAATPIVVGLGMDTTCPR